MPAQAAQAMTCGHSERAHRKSKDRTICSRCLHDAKHRWDKVRRSIALAMLWESVEASVHPICVSCHTWLNLGNWSLDHIVPLCAGGTDERSNLQWMCRRCNTIKGSGVTP